MTTKQYHLCVSQEKVTNGIPSDESSDGEVRGKNGHEDSLVVYAVKVECNVPYLFVEAYFCITNFCSYFRYFFYRN